LLLTADEQQQVRALVQIAPTADPRELEHRIAELGGSIDSWMPDTSLVSLDVPAARLGELASIDGVVYVETGEAYGT
jgi:hypothetical protein